MMFGLPECVRHDEDFVISSFCSIRFSVTLAGLKNIVRYTEDLVRRSFVKSRFHCIDFTRFYVCVGEKWAVLKGSNRSAEIVDLSSPCTAFSSIHFCDATEANGRGKPRRNRARARACVKMADVAWIICINQDL